MALTDVRLSILAFPQRWSDNVLHARILMLPTYDPTQPPPAGSALPAFAGANWALRAVVLPGTSWLPGAAPSGLTGAQVKSLSITAPDGAVDLFKAIAAYFSVAPSTRTPAQRLADLTTASVRKELPPSYQQAVPFERPRAGSTTGTEFGCALRDTTPALAADTKPPQTITWGAALSFVLRQPLLARALGLIYDLTVEIDPPGLPPDGGWLFVDLDPAGPVIPTPPSEVRSYAARLPSLTSNNPRNVFAAVLFPVGPAGADYSEPLEEASTYDDGFAKIMHIAQAVTADATSSGHNDLPPGTDAGFDLGWDDEQVTVWMNRQLDALRARLNPAALPTAESPLGVSGYRIDVRLPESADPALNNWSSLCRAVSVDAAGNPASLIFPPAPAQPLFSVRFDDELAVEPTPIRSIHTTDGAAWLPRHFGRWQDGSLVAADPTLLKLTGESPRDAKGNAISIPSPAYASPDLPVQLRYGLLYEFRCRLRDLTGGGPLPSEDATNPALHPTARGRFLRHVPPKSVRLQTNIPRPAPGTANPPVPTVASIEVWRPLIGYPEMKFTGIDDPATLASVLAAASAARDAGEAVGVNDPDVTELLVSVQVRAPAHDPGPEGVRDGAFREVYAATLSFPEFDPADVLNPGTALHIDLDYVDVPDVSQMTAPAAGESRLPIPRGRDVRLRLTPLCGDKPNYFGSDEVRKGLTVDIATRAEPSAETALWEALPPSQTDATAILLQEAPDMATRLADRLRLACGGLSFSGRPGERVLFGASPLLRHTLAADGSSIEFATAGELLNRWIVAIQMEVSRDWTWDGLDDAGVVISRQDAPAAAVRVAGQIKIPFVAATTVLQGPDEPGLDRRAQTRLVFFDAVDPKPPPGAFPKELSVRWNVLPQIRGFTNVQNEALASTQSLHLPVSVAPRQTPKLVSAGIALSPYTRDDEYASTNARQRVLWFELDAPVDDPNDALFARVLAYGPDPLLSGAITHLLVPTPAKPVGGTTWFDIVEKVLPNPPAPAPLAVDPEPIRVIVPGQPRDTSGLDAMTSMVAADSANPAERSRHYMVPLPPGMDVDSPEMFGFWTYELRIGHVDVWSTAQARFGRPLVVKGVQHPPPKLLCTAVRVRPALTKLTAYERPRIVVAAPLAVGVFQGQRLTDTHAGDPRTRIWVLLYAQVSQADGATKRNILLARAPGIPQRGSQQTAWRAPQTRDTIAVAQFDEQVIADRLRDLAIPSTAPLSVIAVELLPGDHLLQREVIVADTEVFYTVDIPDTPQSDPLGAELGAITARRILRCSPLTAVAPAC